MKYNHVYIVSPVSAGECVQQKEGRCPRKGAPPASCKNFKQGTYDCPYNRARRNHRLFIKAVREVVDAGYTPIASQWLAYGPYLNDADPKDREAGIRIGEQLLWMLGTLDLITDERRGWYSPAVWVYGYTTEPTDTRTVEIEGRYVSEGMAVEIKLAHELALHIEWKE